MNHFFRNLDISNLKDHTRILFYLSGSGQGYRAKDWRRLMARFTANSRSTYRRSWLLMDCWSGDLVYGPYREHLMPLYFNLTTYRQQTMDNTYEFSFYTITLILLMDYDLWLSLQRDSNPTIYRRLCMYDSFTLSGIDTVIRAQKFKFYLVPISLILGWLYIVGI